jgi:hypothetical protein
MKPLDFVSPKKHPDRIGLVTEVTSHFAVEKELFRASIAWIGGEKGLYSAWWYEDELIIVDNLPILLANNLAHPFGNGKDYVKRLM